MMLTLRRGNRVVEGGSKKKSHRKHSVRGGWWFEVVHIPSSEGGRGGRDEKYGPGGKDAAVHLQYRGHSKGVSAECGVEEGKEPKRSDSR